MKNKFVVFKDDDAGVDLERLKKWIDVVITNDAKGSVGLIGKHLKNPELTNFLNSLDSKKVEIFCHGYHHRHFPYIISKLTKSNELPKTEFNKDIGKHESSLRKYREEEYRYLNSPTASFGPQGNIWNEEVVEPLLKHDFKLMFSWKNVGGGIFTIPLSQNFRHDSLDAFIKDYKNKENDLIYTLQFHHAKLSDKNFQVLAEVIDFLKNKEKRIFVTPSELIEISKKDKGIHKLMTEKN